MQPMKTIVNVKPRPKNNLKIKFWTFERKFTLAGVLIILSGFVTFGEVLGKISQLNEYMKNTNDMREQLAVIKVTTTNLISETNDIKISLRRIEDNIIKRDK